MNIEVKYQDKNGNLSDLNYKMSKLAFIKHFSIAGQRYAPHPQKILRTIGMFLHYSNYLNRDDFYNSRFSEPAINISDPTEKGQFSNLSGKAIADFLAKRIDNALYSVNYEAAMRMKKMPLSVNKKPVRRPDLLAFKQNGTFAIEVKGYSGSAGDMNDHKEQSKTGGIPVNFTVASVSHNLYRKVKCNYYDPYNKDVSFDSELFRGLTKEYYSGFLKFIENSNYRESNYQNESFYEVDLFYPPFWEKNFKMYRKPFHYFWEELFHFYRPRLIIPSKIQHFGKEGISNDVKPFLFEYMNDNLKDSENRIYIDNDRIGLKIERNGW